jgi:hypothetical protein
MCRIRSVSVCLLIPMRRATVAMIDQRYGHLYENELQDKVDRLKFGG